MSKGHDSKLQDENLEKEESSSLKYYKMILNKMSMDEFLLKKEFKKGLKCLLVDTDREAYKVWAKVNYGLAA